MKLSQKTLENVKSALFNTARILDIALYKYKFKNGEKKSVIKELIKYQNDDGGFGHGIEPEIGLKGSSSLATTVGIQCCLKANLSADHEIIQKAIEYFIKNLKSEGVYWPNTYEDVNNELHPPWWEVEKITEPPIKRWANANAEIAGYSFKLQDKTSTEVTALLEKKILAVLNQTEIINDLSNLICWEKGLSYFPSEIKDKTRDLIIKSYKDISSLTQEKLGEVRIFFLNSKPSDLINEILPEEVSKILDEEIKLLDSNKTCLPTWEWGIYPEAWVIVKNEWIGKMTVDFLITLKNYDRLN